MPRLKIKVDDHQLYEDRLKTDLSGPISDNDGIQLIKAMYRLMKSEDVGFWLSQRLMRSLKAFATKQQGEHNQSKVEVDDKLFLSWLEQVGSVEPNVKWEVESLPNNGGIYKIIFKGGEK